MQKGSLSQSPDSAEIRFYYNGKFYITSSKSNNYLTASQANGKAKYTLPEGWFVNYYDAKDSVLIRGVFNEP